MIEHAELHQKTPLFQYVECCEKLRGYYWKHPNLSKEEIHFFEKCFVEEIEPLGLISKNIFGDSDKVLIQYVRRGEDPPDGIIYIDNKEIGVEFTTSADNRLMNHVREQQKKGSIISLTGHTSKEIMGSRNKGYVHLGSEAECIDTETIPNRILFIRESLDKKIKKGLKKASWLCVLVDDATIPLNDSKVFHYALIQLVEHLTPQFPKHLTKLIFLGVNRNEHLFKVFQLS